MRVVSSPGIILDDDNSIRGQNESSLPLPTDTSQAQVEEILAQRAEEPMKIHDLAAFNTTPGFLTMHALSMGCPHKAGLQPLFPPSLIFTPSQGETGDILSVVHQVLVDWDHQIAPGAKTTGTAQIVSAVGAPFLLGADAEARDKEPS